MGTTTLALLAVTFPGLGFTFLHASTEEAAPAQPEAIPALAGPADVWNPALSLSEAATRAATSAESPPEPAATPAPDSRRTGTYFRVGAGLVTTEESDGADEDIEFDEGYMIDLALGHRFGDSDDSVGFGLELEGLWTDQDADDDPPIQAVSDITVIAAMLNGIVDFQMSENFGLYAGAGIGTAWMDVGTESDAFNDFDDEDGPFLAWQARAGLQLWSSPSLAWHLGYRFLNIDDVEIDDDLGGAEFDLETSQHMLEAGASFGF